MIALPIMRNRRHKLRHRDQKIDQWYKEYTKMIRWSEYRYQQDISDIPYQ